MIHTVDIDNIKKVLDICKHYDDIINYEVKYNDIISFDLIDFYKDYIFSCKNEDKIKLIDNIIYRYVSDYNYQKGLKKIIIIRDIDLNSERKTNKLIKKIIKYNDNYEKDKIFNITVSKWI